MTLVTLMEHVRNTIIAGDAKIGKVLQLYNEMEALEAFQRAAKQHEWSIPDAITQRYYRQKGKDVQVGGSAPAPAPRAQVM